MRHEQIFDTESYRKVDVSAVWPVGVQVAPLPVPDVEDAPGAPFAPAPSTPDVPAAVGGLIVASYAVLLGTFALATAGSGQSIFAIVICAIFLAAFFTVPRLFLGLEPKQGRRPSFDQFMARGMDTLTGHTSGRAALVQMLVVPVSLTLGAIAIGIAVAINL